MPLGLTYQLMRCITDLGLVRTRHRANHGRVAARIYQPTGDPAHAAAAADSLRGQVGIPGRQPLDDVAEPSMAATSPSSARGRYRPSDAIIAFLEAL